MIFNKLLLPTLTFSALTILSCAAQPQHVADINHTKNTSHYNEVSGEVVTESAARADASNNFVEIEFKEGSTKLTDSAKASLKKLITEASNDGKINQINILSWADQEYPSKSLKNLSAVQRTLAERRNNNIEAFVKTMRASNVYKFNMAEQPSAIAHMFNSNDSKLKNSFIAAGLPTTADSSKYASKASHSVILVKLE